MTEHIGIDEYTVAQDTESWNRPRTNEELKDFVEHHLGRLGLEAADKQESVA